MRLSQSSVIDSPTPVIPKLRGPVRIVTAAALFDGHDASINIIRRLLQDHGAEVIHLGHNRSVTDIVHAVLQEGAQGVCVSSYQGGHMEFFKYMKDLLDQAGAPYVKIYGGGGGVIVFDEKRELEAYGIARIFHPEEGRKLGLEGMIAEILAGCDFDIVTKIKATKVPATVTGAASAKQIESGRASAVAAASLVDGLLEGREVGDICSTV